MIPLLRENRLKVPECILGTSANFPKVGMSA